METNPVSRKQGQPWEIVAGISSNPGIHRLLFPAGPVCRIGAQIDTTSKYTANKKIARVFCVTLRLKNCIKYNFFHEC